MREEQTHLRGLDPSGLPWRRLELPSVAKQNGKQFRENISIFFQFLNLEFLATLAPNMHETKRRGARDLWIVKVSARYDVWPSKKRQKNDKYEKS